MKSILKSQIDYSLFEKYDKDYFVNNKILPIFENDISIKIAVCKSSNLKTIKDDFPKLISFIQVEELELLFILSHINRKILLYSFALKAISQNSFEKYIDKFLQELISFSIDFGLTLDSNLTIFFPSRDTKNLVKFHLISFPSKNSVECFLRISASL